MAQAHYLTDKDGEKFYPYAHAKATYDSNGVTVEARLNSLGTASTKSVTTEITSSTDLPTANAVKQYVDNAVSNSSNYLGTISSIDSLKTDAIKGDFYRVATAWDGVHVGDIIIAEKNNPSKTIDGVNWSLLHNEIDTDTVDASNLVCDSANYGGETATTSVQTALNNLASAIGKGGEEKTFVGTTAEVQTKIADGTIKDGWIVIVTDD